MLTLNLFPTPVLCKKCIHYRAKEGTCVRSIIATSKSKVFYSYTKSVRDDEDKCGPDAVWFQEAEP
jgi:hypothetical protein